MYVSPLLAKPPLRNKFPSINYVQDSISFIGAYLPILHLEMELAKNAHLQSPKISIEITSLSFRRACKRHKPQFFMSALANSQPTRKTLKSPTLFLRIDIFALFNVTSKVEIKSSRRQFLGLSRKASITAGKKGRVFFHTCRSSPRDMLQSVVFLA